MASQPGAWKYNPVTGVVLVIVIAGAVVGMFFINRMGRTTLGPTQKIVVVCEETGKVFYLDVQTGDPGPYESPETGIKTAWPAIRCQNCGIIYAMKETPADKIPCPQCGMRVPTVVVLLSKPEEKKEE